MFIQLHRQNELKPTIVNVSHIVCVDATVLDDSPASKVTLVDDGELHVTETQDQIRALLSVVSPKGVM